MKPTRPPTEFEMQVYAVVRTIPCGRVSTYGTVAQRTGRGTARAVGSALAKNPYAPEVPCHRVVRADGALGGFNGETAGPEMAKKVQLLESEGIVIKAGMINLSRFGF
jgi:methylated-DNA-[protein]-cysteine S-methyltransferase